MPRDDDNPWMEYRRLVMDHMTRTDQKLDAINTRLSKIESDISSLQVKAGVWGAVAGVLTTLGAVVIAILAKLF